MSYVVISYPGQTDCCLFLRKIKFLENNFFKWLSRGDIPLTKNFIQVKTVYPEDCSNDYFFHHLYSTCAYTILLIPMTNHWKRRWTLTESLEKERQGKIVEKTWA